MKWEEGGAGHVETAVNQENRTTCSGILREKVRTYTKNFMTSD